MLKKDDMFLYEVRSFFLAFSKALTFKHRICMHARGSSDIQPYGKFFAKSGLTTRTSQKGSHTHNTLQTTLF